MTLHRRQIARLMLVVLAATTLAGTLSGCAGGPEFRGVPQEGANRSGVFPNFGHMPKGETAQFTAQQQKDLTASLDSERGSVNAVRNEAPLSAAKLALLRKQAQAEADATLKAIENSDN